MSRLVRKDSIIRIAAIVTAGSGLLYAKRSSNYKTNVAVSIPESFRDELSSLPCQTLEGRLPQPLFGLSYPPQNGQRGKDVGVLSLLSSREAPIPPPSNIKRDSGISKDSPKPCCGCLGRNTIANAAACVGPAVVNISIPNEKNGTVGGKGIGSGTIIDKDGTILTCAHAVVDFHGLRPSMKGKVHVTLQDGRTFVASVMNVDLHSDIAIVKINSKTPLPTAKLGSSTKLQPGDWVLAMGCPLSLQNTVTAGIVSCVDRKSSDLGLGGLRREYLQTDCAINPGNSGGPLVNIDGEVVGVNIMKLLAADGLSFAVPIDSVTKIIEHFKKSGRVVRPWLGLKMLDLNEMVIAQLKERSSGFPNVEKGVLVPSVTPESPGDRAGFLPGDVVVEFDGKPVASIKEIIDIMGDRVGVPLKAVVKRANNKQATLTVVPEEVKHDI
ncbi:putative protease Do-like 14 isoform X1 [Ziziphus jujuba]|uniref:Protease Do-like 14 isoform X1 n=1 Tax=Ziziphus jujuba TaxID=326968 RepID=A0A6P3ZN76_ZIZJJ|nr:putative protease Do-like 14 isoform X1 [Ziziphus jujuba]